MTDELFRVVEPSGKTYRVFTDGRIDGFEPGSVIANFFRSRAFQLSESNSHAPDSPTISAVSARGGGSHGDAPSASSLALKNATADGV